MTSVAINHPLYVQTVKNLDRVAVRDKLLRLVQYFSRFAGYYALRKGYSGEVVKQLQALTKNLSLARKAFRAGKPLQNLRALVQELATQTTQSVEHFTSIAKNVGSGLYLTLDTLQFLHAIGTVKLSSPTARRVADWANRFWLLGILASIVEAGYGSYVERQRLAALAADEKKAPGELRQAHAALQHKHKLLVWNLIDAVIPLSNLGVLHTNDGLVGLAGTITAYLGLKEIW